VLQLSNDGCVTERIVRCFANQKSFASASETIAIFAASTLRVKIEKFVGHSNTIRTKVAKLSSTWHPITQGCQANVDT